MKQNKLFLIPLFLFLGCGVSTRVYQKIASDTHPTLQKLAILAPFVSTNYPVKETFIQGKSDTTLLYDTIVTNSIYHDTITNKIDSIVIKKVQYTKVIVRTDTIKVKETVDCYLINQQLLLSKEKIKDLEIYKHKTLWLFVVISAILTLIIILFTINKFRK